MTLQGVNGEAPIEWGYVTTPASASGRPTTTSFLHLQVNASVDTEDENSQGERRSRVQV